MEHGFEPVGDFAKVDYDRSRRCGFPEAVYGEGKSGAQIAAIMDSLAARHAQSSIIATRCSGEKYAVVQQSLPQAQYDETARMIYIRRPAEPKGCLAVFCAGTSDLPVAEEAALTVELMGARVERAYDVGVAGVHRLLAQQPLLERARAVVVAAGMEGALGSVISGLTAAPVIAVPTSVGYGASFQGLAALLAMLNSCAAGLAVVNIDNGFGAGYMAAMINQQSL